MISGAGHIPHSFDRLFYLMAGPCYLLDFILPKRFVPSPLLVIVICAAFGLFTYTLVGLLIDIALQRYRDRLRRMMKAKPT